MSKKAERRELFRALSQEPTFLEDMCSFVSEGKTLAQFTKSYDIKYMDVWNWLDEVPSRRSRYNEALEVQGHVHRDVVTGGLVGAATADIAEFFDGEGSPLPVSDIPPEARANIQGIEVTVSDKGAVTTKYRLADKTRNRELLGKKHGMFVDKVEHGGNLTLEQMVSSSMARPEGPQKGAADG